MVNGYMCKQGKLIVFEGNSGACQLFKIVVGHWPFSKPNWSFLKTCKGIWPFSDYFVNFQTLDLLNNMKWPNIC